jgi:hypothetical protein
MPLAFPPPVAFLLENDLNLQVETKGKRCQKPPCRLSKAGKLC